MEQRAMSIGRRLAPRVTVITVVAAITLASIGVTADTMPARVTSGTVLQTNLVSDLAGVAAIGDPNLVNPWGISESSGSPFWISDNGAGAATLYRVPPISTVALVVTIPTPHSLTGCTPTGTVFNTGLANRAFTITGQAASAPAVFLFATEDGTIAGWNPGIDPVEFSGPPGTSAVIAVDNSGNNFTNPDPTQQTGAVYKGLAIETSSTPVIAADPDSTALLYASNFRSGTIDVYDAKFSNVTTLPSGAFRDPALPKGYAPFNVQVLNGKVYVDYALQDATRHDPLAGRHHGFVDVFNLDGTPGLPGGAMRLISRGALDSPWGLAIAPQGFAGLGGASTAPVLLVGNFGDGLIHAFDAMTGTPFGQLADPDGEPIKIDGLWALKVGNGGAGGSANTVYFSAGLFRESHGLFGSLAAVAPGSPEGPAEAQWLQANTDVVQHDQQRLASDSTSGAPLATIRQDIRTLDEDSHRLADVQRAFEDDSIDDATN